MNCLNQEQSNKILNLVREVEKLNDVERLLLYLQLPCGRAELPEGKYKNNSTGCALGAQKQSTDIFSKKSDQETTKTYTWILSHLEENPNVSLPKQEVYDEYRAFCQANRFEPLCVADFGKAMKHALPCIKPRRLGQRGNSRYCYSGLRKKYKIEAPSLPNMMLSCDLQSPTTSCSSVTTEHHYADGLNGGPSRAKSASFASSRQYECPPNSCTSSPNRPRPNGHGGTIMNLKIEPCTSTQATCVSAPLLPSCCSASTSNQAIGACGAGSSAQHVPTDQYPQHQQAPPLGAPHHYQAGTFTHRSGTPDDDDYRHNYHDLNRPIVGPAVIPFSQSIHAQLAQQPAQHNSFISYDNQLPQAQSQPAAVDEATQEHQRQKQQQQQPPQHHSHHNHHHQQPQQQQHELNFMNKHSVHDRCHEQHSIITTLCCREANKINSSEPVVTTDSRAGSEHQRAQFISSNGPTMGADHSQQQHVELSEQQQQHHHHHHHPDHHHSQEMPQADSQLHLNLNMLDHCAGSNMEFCTSPFQSPASTPYPNMSNYPSVTQAQDTREYFSSDCAIQYLDH